MSHPLESGSPVRRRRVPVVQAPSQRPSGVFGHPLESPITRLQRDAQQRVDRARRRLPNPTPAPRAPRPTPAPAPSRSQLRSSRAQARGYGSQGRQVRHAARRQEVVARERAQERYYGSQGRLVEREAHRQLVAAAGWIPVVAREVLRSGEVSPAEVRRSRLAYLRAHREHGTALLDRLVFRTIPGAVSHLVDTIGHNRVIVSTGGGPGFTRLVPGQHGGGGFAAMLAPTAYRADNPFSKGLVKDALNYLLYAPQTAVAAGEAATGNTRRAKQLVGGLTHGVVGELARGNPKAALKVAEQHPLYALMELHGAEAAAGRGLGAAGRSGVFGEGARRAASTARPDRVMDAPGGRVAVRQHYSPDVIKKAVQVLVERASGGRRVSDRDLRRVGDFLSDKAQAGSRVGRAQEGTRAAREAPTRARSRVGRRLDQALPEATGRYASRVVPQRAARPERAVVPLVYTRVVRGAKTFEPDLRKELARLDRQYRAGGFKSASERAANRKQAAAIRRVLSDPKALANAPEVVRGAEALIRRGNELERKAIEDRALNPEQAARAKLFEYAQAHMGARWVKGKGLVDPQGRALSNERIVGRMKADGVPFEDGKPLVGFLPHRADVRGARAFYQRALSGSRRDVAGSHARTGRSFEKGLHDRSFQQVLEHHVRLRGVLNRIAEHDRLVHDAGIRRPDGRLFTWDDAVDFAQNVQDTTGAKLVPYRAAPAKYDEATLRAIVSEQDAAKAPEFERLMEKDFADRLEAPQGEGRKAANVVLIPKQLADQLAAHGHTVGNLGRLGQMATHFFRSTVLPFSTKWLFGNTAEAALRLAVVGAGPNSLRIGHQVLRSMATLDADEAARVEAALVGGLQFGQRNLEVHRTSEMLDRGFEKPGRVLALIGRAPIVKQVRTGVRTYQQAVFHLNRAVEREAQVAALGKHARREMQEMTGSWLKALRAQERAVQDVARGLLDTKNQIDAARYLDETLGKYSRFSPDMRRFIQSAAPFLPWYLNSLRFVLWTLPAKHPVKTAVLTRFEATLQQESDKQHRDVPPGSLRAAVPYKGGLLDVARFTPFGALTDPAGGGSVPQAVLEPLLPQVSSVWKAAYGLNFAGRQAVVSPEGRKPGGDAVSQGTSALMALNAALEAFLPGVAIARRVEEGGKTPYDDSFVWSPKVKPATSHGSGALDRILNPLRPTYLRAGESSAPVGPVDRGSSGGPGVPGVSPAVARALHARARERAGVSVPPAVQRALLDRARGR